MKGGAMRTYHVHIRSKPGPYEQYQGYIEVEAEDFEKAVPAAFAKLHDGALASFPDRNPAMWIVEKVQRVYGCMPVYYG
jgi:hypothetical protein